MGARFLEKIQSYYEDLDESRIKGAFDFIQKHYQDTDLDINYPFKILETLLPLKPDVETIIAVLIHDLYLEGFINDKLVKEDFGNNVLHLLIGLKSLTNLNYAENDKISQIEVLRKMFVTMAKDLRVILIWLALRLVQLKNLEKFPDALNAYALSKETMDLYVPIASRLGIYRMKTDLEDLSFKYLKPNEYKEIVLALEKLGKKRKMAMREIRQEVQDFLSSKGIEAYVSGRLKSYYGIYAKIQRKGLSEIDNLYDLFAIRVIVPASCVSRNENIVDKLYTVLGLIHSEWKPISSRFKDYIAVPKPNGYRSLHTVVLGLSPKYMQQPVEIQIRDTQMHREAEYGIASHWLYKDVRSLKIRNIDSRVQWLKGLESVHEFFGSGSEVMKEVELDVFNDRIFVLTPRGEVKDLPAGSNPIDFAYNVHTDIGHHCVMAKVNGALTPLDYNLRNGDVVEILTKKEATPKLRWLSLVKSNFAKNKIRGWFSAMNMNRENNLREGKVLLNKQLERLQKPLLDQNYCLLKNYMNHNLNLLQRENLIEEIGKGAKFASDVVKKLFPYEKTLPSKSASSFKSQVEYDEKEVLEKQVVIAGEDCLPVKIAACCKPKMKDSIVAYVTTLKIVSIHRIDCKFLKKLNPQRFLYADWKSNYQRERGSFKVGIKLTVVSRVGLMQDITSVIASFGLSIIDVKIQKKSSNMYLDSFLLDWDDLNKFDELLDKLEEINGVVKVSKDESF